MAGAGSEKDFPFFYLLILFSGPAAATVLPACCQLFSQFNTTKSYYKTRILFFQFFTAKKRLKIYMYTMREAMSHGRI